MQTECPRKNGINYFLSKTDFLNLIFKSTFLVSFQNWGLRWEINILMTLLQQVHLGLQTVASWNNVWIRDFATLTHNDFIVL